jgi:hypothetical protein
MLQERGPFGHGSVPEQPGEIVSGHRKGHGGSRGLGDPVGLVADQDVAGDGKGLSRPEKVGEKEVVVCHDNGPVLGFTESLPGEAPVLERAAEAETCPRRGRHSRHSGGIGGQVQFREIPRFSGLEPSGDEHGRRSSVPERQKTSPVASRGLRGPDQAGEVPFPLQKPEREGRARAPG